MKQTELLINYNGKIIPAGQPLFGAENRAFRYGDGLFETLRMFDGVLPFWEEHWERITAGANYLQFQDLEDSDFYKKEVQKLCGAKGNWRIRWSLFRKNGGKYTPLNPGADFLIEATPLDSKQFELNGKGVQLALCDSLRIPRHPLSNFKTINSLPYVLAGIYKAKHQLADCILLNDKNEVVEASSSNIFMLRNGKLRTPPLSSGCKDGTLRRVIIRVAEAMGIAVSYKPFKTKKLLKADEIWLSNAISGLVWVESFEGKVMRNEMVLEVMRALEEERMKRMNK